MANPVGLSPNYARVIEPESQAGAKEYVPVNAEHERLIAAGQSSAEGGLPVRGFMGVGSRRRVALNCTYDVMAPDGQVSQRRAGHLRTFNPSKESMSDRACEGILFRNPTFEEEALAMNPHGGGRAYPRFLGWGPVSARRLGPELPRSYGVRVGGR